MTDEDLIEAIREQAGWGMSRHVARKILAVVAPEIGRRAADIAMEDWTPAYGAPRSDMEALADSQRTGIAYRILAAFHARKTRPDTDPLRETF